MGATDHGPRTVEALLRATPTAWRSRFPATHRERENALHGVRGYNIGGDYHYKRLLWLEWPAGTMVAHTFGAP